MVDRVTAATAAVTAGQVDGEPSGLSGRPGNRAAVFCADGISKEYFWSAAYGGATADLRGRLWSGGGGPSRLMKRRWTFAAEAALRA